MATPQPIKGGTATLESLHAFVAKNLEELFYRLNFRPNDRGKAGNFDAEIVTFTTTFATDMVIPHKLERVPSGWIVTDKNNWCDLYMVSSTTSNITFKANVPGIIYKVLVF